MSASLFGDRVEQLLGSSRIDGPFANHTCLIHQIDDKFLFFHEHAGELHIIILRRRERFVTHTPNSQTHTNKKNFLLLHDLDGLERHLG